MGRRLLAVLLGYVTMFVLVFCLFSAAFLVLGTERSFLQGSYEPTATWNVVSIVLGFVAAVAGGFVAAKVGRSASVAKTLAIVVFILGVIFAIPQITQKTDPGPRPGNVSNMEAMQKAQMPAWMAILNPFIGAAGAWVASRRVRV